MLFPIHVQVADQLDLQRIGPQHQAGSDSLLTGAAFFKMREMFFEDNIDDVKYCGHLYGLGTSFVNGGSTAVSNLLSAATTSASMTNEGNNDNSINSNISNNNSCSAIPTTTSTPVSSTASAVNSEIEVNDG